jgi:hypothetical protein
MIESSTHTFPGQYCRTGLLHSGEHFPQHIMLSRPEMTGSIPAPQSQEAGPRLSWHSGVAMGPTR